MNEVTQYSVRWIGVKKLLDTSTKNPMILIIGKKKDGIYGNVSKLLEAQMLAHRYD